jgi:hypothetical protein
VKDILFARYVDKHVKGHYMRRICNKSDRGKIDYSEEVRTGRKDKSNLKKMYREKVD